MYAPDTVLALKKPRDPDPETNEAFPYNEVKVIGQSPISHAATGDWNGADGQGVIITPLSNFGSTLDEPYGKLRALYDVKSIPEQTVEPPKVRIVSSNSQSAGPTPEEVFAEEAPGVPPAEGETRGRTPISPLDDPRPKDSSPLTEKPADA